MFYKYNIILDKILHSNLNSCVFNTWLLKKRHVLVSKITYNVEPVDRD